MFSNVLFFVFSISTALATGIHSAEIACPVDNTDTVKLYFALSSNEFGGFDSDGATYSSGTQFRKHAISTCTNSLFSAYTEDMQRSFSPAEITEIQAWLTPLRTQYLAPQPWEQYELAANFYRWQGKPALFMGRLYLEAAWTVRDEAVGIHPDLKGPVVADQILTQGKLELAKDLTPEQRKMVTFNLARVAHRNAQFSQREYYLKLFLADPNLETWEREAGERFRQLTETIEPKYLKLALAEYLTHLQQAPQDGQTLYLVGDLFRRLNNPTQAKLYFEKAINSPHLYPEQRLIIQHLLEE